jgi:hypothetical protein
MATFIKMATVFTRGILAILFRRQPPEPVAAAPFTTLSNVGDIHAMVFSGPAQGLLCDPALTGLG